MANDYRPIMELKKLDWCVIMENLLKYPNIVKPIKFVNSTFPGLVGKCPYNVSFTFVKVSFNHIALYLFWFWSLSQLKTHHLCTTNRIKWKTSTFFSPTDFISLLYRYLMTSTTIFTTSYFILFNAMFKFLHCISIKLKIWILKIQDE